MDYSDREGRLEDRPKKIKAAVLPYDECDVDRLLDEWKKEILLFDMKKWRKIYTNCKMGETPKSSLQRSKKRDPTLHQS
jgi:hypothetical protein